MAQVDQPLKIKPVPYNDFSEPDPSIVIGETFLCTKPFILLSSKGLPQNKKIYMEVTLTKNIVNKSIRHIPLYLGIHKEPSSGVLANDCVMMSCYYTLSEDFDIFERAKGTIPFAKQSVGKLKSRIPIVNSIIGLGVDMDNNLISIYVDGKLFYEFTSALFNFNDETNGPWYFAVYNKLYESIGGKVNYGRYKVEYLPEGYETLYQYYYYNVPDPIPPTPIEPYVPTGTITRYDFDCTINAENDIAPIDPITKKRHPFLEHKVDAMWYENDTSFQMYANRGSTAPDMTTVNYPCPADPPDFCPVYLEFNIKEAIMTKDDNNLQKYIGIPIEVGLTV